MIKAYIFDFGGVIAEEGFREGLKAIGKKNGLDPDSFYAVAHELVYRTGYVSGRASEAAYWDAVRAETGVRARNEEMREEIISRFVLRPEMLEEVTKIRAKGLFAALLTDQTNWLDEINQRTPFYKYFDLIFNSYVLKKNKRDPSIFHDVVSVMAVAPDEAVFVDDNQGNVERAAQEGLKVIHFTKVGEFQKRIQTI